MADNACGEASGHRGAFTVNSSNHAVPIYERWGFRRAGPAENSNGIVYKPMKLEATTVDAPVQLEPYNPAWPEAFLAECDLLTRVLEPWLVARIEHVGSTAVPGLPAKPVIDIMAPVEDLESSRAALTALQAIGYCYAPYKSDVMHWLCKPNSEHRTHHLHLVPLNSRLWADRLAFRDLLTSDASVARDYAALKFRLAAAYRDDRERYTEEKGPFIESALRGASGAV